MLISRHAKIFAAALFAVSLAACTTTKTADTSAAVAEQSAAEKAAADKAAADKAAADAAARASAASTNSGIESQSLADKAAADAAAKANQLANSLNVKVFHFDYDNATIATSDYDALKAHALYLSKNPAARVQVGGHTDERGTREYNMALGERRAKAVAAFLTSNGAKSGQLEVISYGEEKPVATGDSEEVWARNRRVELEYTSGAH
ncbi:MAG: peptidoglycan-associated lipoprotein Pal [bacterium]|nr:peptidoglycan-associated lipoprotein Pal [bacterium]